MSVPFLTTLPLSSGCFSSALQLALFSPDSFGLQWVLEWGWIHTAWDSPVALESFLKWLKQFQPPNSIQVTENGSESSALITKTGECCFFFFLRKTEMRLLNENKNRTINSHKFSQKYVMWFSVEVVEQTFSFSSCQCSDAIFWY